MVERFFARITTEAIRRGSFSSVRELQAAIDASPSTTKIPNPLLGPLLQILSLENSKTRFLKRIYLA
jgi:hypothetical protein